jgi:DNA invertase Pin-like site-specific DNA recombinase
MSDKDDCMKSTKAVGYARVIPRSTSEEALAHQGQRIASYCHLQQLELVQIFEETVSAEISLADGRKVLDEALAAVPDHGALVVVRVDRLSRNRRVLKEIQSKCDERGITVHTMEGPTDLSKVKTSIEVTVLP